MVPLRARLSENLEAAGDGTEAAATRAGDLPRVEGPASTSSASDTGRAATAAGRLRRLARGTPVCWVLDPAGRPCPDVRGQRRSAGAVPARRALPHGASVRPRVPPGADACLVRLTLAIACRLVRIPSRSAAASPPAASHAACRTGGRIILVVGVVLLFVLFRRCAASPASTPTTSGSTRSAARERLARACCGAKIGAGDHLHGSFFAAACGVNLCIADRLAPTFRPAGPEEEFIERYQRDRRAAGSGWCRIGVVAAARRSSPGAGVSSEWKDWLLFTNAGSFGVEGPAVRHRRRLLRLPAAVPDASSSAGCSPRCVIVLIVTAVAHYLNGGIRLQVPAPAGHAAGEGPPVGAARPCWPCVKAAGYWLQRYDAHRLDPGLRRRRRPTPT